MLKIFILYRRKVVKHLYGIMCVLMLFGLSCVATEITEKQVDEWIKNQPTEIDLHDTNITAKGLDRIVTNVKSLKTLNLAGCKNIEWDSGFLKFDSWEKQKALEELNLQGTEITAKGLYNIVVSVPSLKMLNLAGCKNIEWDSGLLKFDSWGKQGKLEELNLQGTEITAKGLYNIVVSVPSLKMLNLAGCKNIEWDSGLLKFDSWEKQGKLEELNLQDTEITAKGLHNIVVSVKNLKKLNLSGCKTINWELLVLDSDSWVKQKALEELNLQDTAITAGGLYYIVRNVPSLKKLNLAGCKKINWDLGVLDGDVWVNQKNLTDLSLKGTVIDAKWLYEIVLKVPSLKKLNLEGCAELPADIINNFSNKDPLDTEKLLEALIKNPNLFPDFSKALSIVVTD